MRLDLGNINLTEQLKAMQEQMARDNAVSSLASEPWSVF